MVEASALGLADSLTPAERADDLLYPRLERIREISAYIALRVIRQAQKDVRTFTQLLRSLCVRRRLVVYTNAVLRPLLLGCGSVVGPTLYDG